VNVPPVAGVTFATVEELGRRLRARELSPVALAEACLERISRVAPKLWCFVNPTPQRALEEARVAEAELARGRWRGPLHGIPYGLKDLVDTKGLATTFGARPFATRVPDRDATVQARLREAGAVLLGKLSMIELAGGLGYHWADAALNGACRTPWDLSRWAGGSSSGAASAVAGGLVSFAIGSETWGSITCPAAFCGVTGLRPTYGVVSRHGAMPVSWTLDKLGPLCRSARDAALVLRAIAGRDPRDPTSVDPPPGLDAVVPAAAKGLRAAVLGLPEKPPVSADVKAIWEAALATLERLGLALERAKLPDLPYEDLAVLFFEAEAGTAFEDVIRSGRTRELSDRSHRERSPDDYLSKGSATDYVRAMRLRGDVQRALGRFFDRYDLVVAPNLPYVAPPVDESLDPLFDGSDPLGAAGNLAGLPALALPMGFAGPGKLPVSMQLVGKPFDEARLLATGALWQEETRFHLERPPV